MYVFAETIGRDELSFAKNPTGTTLDQNGVTLIWLISLTQAILLKVVLPVLLIGTSLYVAYELFTAEWDEAKMKKAWKSLTFSGVALVCIAVAYAFVSIVSTLSL